MISLCLYLRDTFDAPYKTHGQYWLSVRPNVLTNTGCIAILFFSVAERPHAALYVIGIFLLHLVVSIVKLHLANSHHFVHTFDNLINLRFISSG